MSKVIEADFLPRDGGSTFSWSSLVNLVARPWFNQTRRVLVIDNDRETTRLLKVLLESKGDYFVVEENDPVKAHQTAREFRPDVILLDIVMPGTDGGEVAALIHKDPDLRRIPIIFLTALVTKAEAKSGLKIDGHTFVAKPITISEVIDAIEQHLTASAKAG